MSQLDEQQAGSTLSVKDMSARTFCFVMGQMLHALTSKWSCGGVQHGQAV